MALDAQREGLKSLKENETAHGGERRAGVPQQNGACARYVRCGTHRIGEDDSVVAVVRLSELGEFAGGFPIEFS